MATVIGLSAFYHDSAAALIHEGEIIAAAQEERFTRKKHDQRFPKNALDYCLQMAGIGIDDVDFVVFYDKPFLKFERLLETYILNVPRGFQSFKKAIPVWIKQKLFQKTLIIRSLKDMGSSNSKWNKQILFSEHHFSHAASAYFPSPFEEAVILTMDGVGEWATTSASIGRGSSLKIHKEINFPHSLGLLYSAFTYFLGFKVNSGEYKVMGLAPYGSPRFSSLIRENLVDIKPDGSFRLNQTYFNYITGLTMTNKRFDQLFNMKPRQPDEPLTQVHMDLAASIQRITEEIVLNLTRNLAAETKIKNLCLAGGVALNCVANGKILRDESFENIWIQPAAGDAGGAIGAAFAGYHLHMGRPRVKPSKNQDSMKGSFLGPEFSHAEIINRLTKVGANFVTLSEDQLLDEVVRALKNGYALGWFQGRMEFGPRALGARSILADPRNPEMQKTLNLKVKFRESFRPFAPSVLREDVNEWFDLDQDSPYMLFVADVHKSKQKPASPDHQSLFGIQKLNLERSEVPAVTHVDYSARIQTVSSHDNSLYHKLLKKFKDATDCPVLVNTSFNVRGEPIVCTPEDAFHCFMGTDIERLAIGNCWLQKESQDPRLKKDYKNQFELD